MNNLPTLSVATVCSDAATKEFYLKELIDSIWDISDEIIIVIGDKEFEGETFRVLRKWYPSILDSEYIIKNPEQSSVPNKFKIYHNPWEWKIRKNMARIQKSIAISHCKSDFIMLMDCDEVFHEDDVPKLRKCLELGHDAYAFHTIHFWRDFDHYIEGDNPSDLGQKWYDYRVHLFKNNLGIVDLHDQYGNYDCSLVDFDYKPLLDQAKKTSIKIYHYGHCGRSKEAYLKKKNDIERSYHLDHKDLSDWEWEMSGTKKFTGEHPAIMKERIKKHKLAYPEYYND